MKRRIVVIFLILAMSAALFACDGGSNPGESSAENDSVNNSFESDTDENESDEKESGDMIETGEDFTSVGMMWSWMPKLKYSLSLDLKKAYFT